MLKTTTNNSAKKAIASYYVLSLLLTLPLLIPIWLIKGSLWVIVYLLCFLIYTRIAITFAVRLTVMPSLWKELDAEKYAAIINAKSFRVHYSYRLNLYFSTIDMGLTIHKEPEGEPDWGHYDSLSELELGRKFGKLIVGSYAERPGK